MCEQIMTSGEGSFARFTVMNRIPGIVEDLITRNRFSPEEAKGLAELRESLPFGPLTPLDRDYPYSGEINKTLSEHPEYGWLNGPFLFIENYLYHRISQICGYFSRGYDYFRYKKEGEARRGLEKFAEALEEGNRAEDFSGICLMNLMGNRADLSQHSSYYSSDSSSELLIDHRRRAAEKTGKCRRVDIILDNAGEELFYDLLLARWLLSREGAAKVKLHFKGMPYFVSDALISDYRSLLSILEEGEVTARFAGEMNRLEAEGRLELGADPFLAGGRPFSRMAPGFASELSRPDLIIFKGDLNYRRLVGDRYWPHERKTSSLVDYFPGDILISRVLKSEVMVGLEPDKVPRGEGNDWMFSGKYGQIEFVEGRGIPLSASRQDIR